MTQTALDKYKMNRAAAGDGTTPEAIKLVGADALTPVLQQMIDGNAPKEFLDFAYGGRIVPVPKKNGSIRPVSVVTALGKLASNLIASGLRTAVREICGTRQLGLGQPSGTELVAAVGKAYLEANPGARLIQLNVRNAFHMIDREKMLEMIKIHYPSFWKRCTWLAYNSRVYRREIAMATCAEIGRYVCT